MIALFAEVIYRNAYGDYHKNFYLGTFQNQPLFEDQLTPSAKKSLDELKRCLENKPFEDCRIIKINLLSLNKYESIDQFYPR